MAKKKAKTKKAESKEEKPKAKTWSFKKQLNVGLKGERFLLKRWEHPVRRNQEFKGYDFVDSNGMKIELKTDSYDLNNTQFFFMERFSDFSTQSPGGPWQALEKGATCFVYLFIGNKVWYVFKDLPALVHRLDELTQDSWGIRIRNNGWTTLGYKVKRDDVKDLYVMEEF